MGVRRVGKTVLSKAADGIEYLDCERPRVRQRLEDAERFLETRKRGTIALDEIHRLPNPSELLKVAADHFPKIRILATGSSTLGASARFRDSLTGRKSDIWLTPMNLADLEDFGDSDLDRRMLQGGLPPYFLADDNPEAEFQDWFDAYWAKDVLELFRLERRTSFLRLLELLLVQSGGIFEATRLARDCEISRTTVSNYLAVLEATFVVHVLRPFASGASREIVAAPKVYAFDTGFVAFAHGWSELRPADRGHLWEHLVLNELHGLFDRRQLHYWRDKAGHEVDFVLALRGKPPIAIECKWAAAQFDAGALHAFRRRHPKGSNYVVTADTDRTYSKEYAGLAVTFIPASDLRNLGPKPRAVTGRR